MEILSIENLTFTYPKTETPAVENVSLQVGEGDFVLLCGASGCGKTTLLKLLKRELTPSGEKCGNVKFCGKPLSSLSDREAASDIGFVMQNPDEQIVTDKVWHELAYGLENLGVPSETIRLRVGETASWFGISDSFRKSTDELSGGQKQLLNLAAVTVMNPRILLLDEPTGQLDPIAATEFVSVLKKLNRELGLTVIIAEHRLEDIFPVADKVAVMEHGKIVVCDAPRAVGKRLAAINKNHPMLAALPSAVRIYSALEGFSETCPLTVREGRDFLEKNFAPAPNAPLPSDEPDSSAAEKDKTPAVELKNVWFRYERDLPDVLRATCLKAYSGEIFCLLGGNGVGKTTTAVNLGVSLAQQGKKVLLVDADAQANLTMSLGYPRPDDLPISLATIMQDIVDDNPIDVQKGILHHGEGVDLLPSNIELSGLEVRLINAISRERVLKTCMNEVKKNYDYVLIDCMPSLGMLTINALAAADSVIIPTQPHYLSAKGLELLLRSVSKVRRQINPHLRIDGILMTMVMPRTNISKEVTALVKSAYGQNIKVFDSQIPHSIRAVEATAEGKSIFAYDKSGKVAAAYEQFGKEVADIGEKQRNKNRADRLR